MQIVWPGNCQRTAELIAVEKVLKGMDSGLITSKDGRCAGAEGVFFWSGAFTTYQSDSLMEKYQGVIAAIEPNVRLYKQARTKIVKDAPIVPSSNQQSGLNFISTAPGTQSSGQYAYFFQDKWTSKVTLFMFDDEYDGTRPEFRFSDIDWLPAVGSDKALDKEKSGHGTCMLSVVLGEVYGVAKRVPRVIFTKVRPYLDSILDGLETAAFIMGQWHYENEVRGYTVMLMTFSSPQVGTLSEDKYKSLLEVLVNDLQVVFVVAAGQNDVHYPQMISPSGEVIHMPAKYSVDYDIITVGGVSTAGGPGFGAQSQRTHGGNLVTVYAPGDGACAIDYKYSRSGRAYPEGTSVSAAYTAGLVAYFLGLPDLGPNLRSFPHVPRAVKEYIQRKAYSRNAASPRPAIWNGLDAHDTKEEWSYWIGDPNVDN